MKRGRAIDRVKIDLFCREACSRGIRGGRRPPLHLESIFHNRKRHAFQTETLPEIWGETIHSNRHLHVFSIVLGVLLLFLTIAVVRLSSVEPPRPIVVRVDEVGRAEALAYEAVQAQADPRDPTTKYCLNLFLRDHFGRRRATAQEYWPRSLRFLSTDLANAAFTANNEEIAMLAAGITLEELRVENVILRIQANPVAPHGAVADFVLVRTQQEREISREQWTATMQFVFMPVIPADLVVFNPMGIQVTYL